MELNGKKYEILYTFKLDYTNKNYIAYTDKSYTNGELNVYVSIFYPNEPEREFEDIEDNKEWDLVLEVLKRLEENDA